MSIENMNEHLQELDSIGAALVAYAEIVNQNVSGADDTDRFQLKLREICREVLRDKVQDLGGCPLCQS
jgi:hypothetical protein